jgi:type VI secretion system protein ImpH
VSEQLLRDCRRYSFFQLVQWLVRERADAFSPGGVGPASRENIRFRANASLGFAASDVETVEPIPGPDGEAEGRYRVTVNFMGIYGPSSPLPTHFTEDVLWAGPEGEGARDFLDLFNHRVISLFYRAWQKYRHPVLFDPRALDEVTRRTLCLMGLGTPGMESGAGLPLVPLLRTAGLLGARQRSAAGLECFLASHFPGVSVRVQSCVERWERIPEADRMRLGRRATRLGVDACLGSQVRDRSSAFRIVLGPLSLPQFRRFLPRTDEYAQLVRLTRLYVTDPLDFDVILRMRAGEVPALKLSASADLPLGQLSWIAPRGTDEGRAELPIRDQDPLTPRTVPALKPAQAAQATPGQPRAPAAPAPRVQSRPVTTSTPTTRRP